jgi:hypothetical protein
MAVNAAATSALALAYIAHNDFGLTPREIRTRALVAASVIAALVVIEFFGKKLRKTQLIEPPPLFWKEPSVAELPHRSCRLRSIRSNLR